MTAKAKWQIGLALASVWGYLGGRPETFLCVLAFVLVTLLWPSRGRADID